VVLPVEQELALNDEQMMQSLRHLLGLMPSGSEWICKCGEPMAVGHACVCPLVRGPASYHRHQAIVGALASAADAQCSTIVDKAPVVVSVEKLFAGRDNGHVVPDLQFTSSLWSQRMCCAVR
jgi:hypothetical protein